VKYGMESQTMGRELLHNVAKGFETNTMDDIVDIGSKDNDPIFCNK